MGFIENARSSLAKFFGESRTTGESAPKSAGRVQRYATAEGRAPRRSSMSKEEGATGTPMYGGYSNADYNPEFNGRSAVEKYEEMRKTDATVNATINAVKLPILQAEYFILPADANDKKQQEIAEFVRKNIECMHGGFRNFLNEALNYKVFGFYYFEKVYRIKDGHVYLAKLAPRLPSAHMKWEMESDPKTPGITQQLPNTEPHSEDTRTIREIPMSKLVLFTNNREGENYEGISILRSAYKHWFIKDLLYKIDGIKHERGAGILTIRTPDGNSDEDMEKAEEMGTRFKLNEGAFIVIPGSKETGWDVDLLTKGIADQSTALLESVRHHDRMISQNILAQFIDLGSGGSGGSYALSKDQTNFFALSLQSTADYMAEAITKQIIEELVRYNFGEQEEYPRFMFGQIGSVDYKEMSEALDKLIGAGLVQVDGKLVEWSHKTFGLPEVKAEDVDAARAKAQPEEKKPGEGDEDEDGEDKPDDGKKPKPGEEPDEEADDDSDIEEPEEEDEEEDPKDEGELGESKFFRKLTAAEERVQLAEVEAFIDDEEAALERELAALNEARKQELLKKAEKILDAGDIAAIAALFLGLNAKARSLLMDAATKALERGKASAAQEIREGIPQTKNFTKRVIEGKIDLALGTEAAQLDAAIKSRLIDLMNNDVGKAAAVAEIERIYDELTARSAKNLTGHVIVDFFNEGRALTFEATRPKLHAMQRSEILDLKTCKMCLTLDGRVLSPNDPFTKLGMVHSGCRGMWVAVLKTDAELPKVKQLPKSVKNRFTTTEGVPATNAFKQMKEPIVRKGSRLEKAIEDGKLEPDEE